MFLLYYCRFNGDSLTAAKIATKKLSQSLEFAIEILPILPYIGVVFSFMGLLSFCFLMSSKGTLTFMSLSNLILLYDIIYYY